MKEELKEIQHLPDVMSPEQVAALPHEEKREGDVVIMYEGSQYLFIENMQSYLKVA